MQTIKIAYSPRQRAALVTRYPNAQSVGVTRRYRNVTQASAARLARVAQVEVGAFQAVVTK